MLTTKLLDDVSARVAAAIAASPARDAEQNWKAMLARAPGKLERVTREEFDLPARALQRPREMGNSLRPSILKIQPPDGDSIVGHAGFAKMVEILGARSPSLR